MEYNSALTPTNKSPINKNKETPDYTNSPRDHADNLESQHGNPSTLTHPGNINPHVNENNNYVLNCPSKIGRACIGEFIGMYVFILLSLGNIAILVLYPEASMTWAGVGISWGINLTMGIYASNHISNSHLNPGVSLAAYIEQKIILKELIYYTIFQVLGAFFAAITVYGIYYNNIKDMEDMPATSIFVTYRQDSITTVAAFFTEMLGSALLICGIFVIIGRKNIAKRAPLYIGALLTGITLSFGYQTAFAFNAARDLGPRIWMSIVGYSPFNYRDSYFWVPIAANYAGAIVGIMVYKVFFK